LATLILPASCRRPDYPSRYHQAWLAFRRNEWQAARDLLHATPSDPFWRANFRLLDAEILLYQNQPTLAAPLLAPDVPPPLAPRRLLLLGYADRLAARFDDAFAKLQAALQSARAARDRSLEAEALLHLARLRQQQQRWDDAELFLARLETLGDDYYRAAVLINRGYQLLRQNRFEPAIAPLEQADHLTRATGSEAANSTAILNLAICRARLGQYDRAEAMLLRLVDVHEKLGALSLIARSQAELGKLAHDLGHLHRAIACYRRAAAASRHRDPEQFARVSGRLAAALLQSGQLTEAFHWNASAAEPDRSQNAALIALQQGRPAEAATLLESALAHTSSPFDRWNLLLQLARAHRARGLALPMRHAYQQAIDTIEQAQASLHRPDYQLSFLSQLIGAYQDYVAVLIDRRELDAAFAVEASSRGRVLASRTGNPDPLSRRFSRPSLRRIAAATGATILSYWLSPAGSHVWIATPSHVHFQPLDVSPTRVAELAAEHNRAIIDQRRALSARAATAAAELWRLLVAPVAPFLSSRVLVIPDGALHELNLETLLDPHGRYWIESTCLAVMPSPHLWSAPQTHPPNLLLIGDPLPADPDFPPLAYAARELQLIRHSFPAPVDSLTARDATPRAFLARPVSRYGFIHFTAHAAANRDSPLDSAVILSPSPGPYKLYARDVMDLQLRAKLVTVSACRSAGARSYSGEGLVGFSWAFLRAGARNVIAGLWDVADVSTPQLMQPLYAALARGLTPAAALRHAKLSLLAAGGNFARPFHWAPFQVYTREKI
jgi:CHAT domain-containing protein/Tfp pilus assembly protein PilF